MSKALLSILIPTTNDRKLFNERIKFMLEWQKNQLENPDDVDIVFFHDDMEHTIGEKRNKMVSNCDTYAMAFFDSDDVPCDGYLQRGIDFAKSGCDVANLIGLYFSNGIYDRPFVHSNQYTHWYTEPQRFVRNNNHLNFIKTAIAKQIPYPHTSFGEDGNYSEALKASNLIHTEFEIKEVLYLYFARSK